MKNMQTIFGAIAAGFSNPVALREAVDAFSGSRGPVAENEVVMRLAMRVGFGRPPGRAAEDEMDFMRALAKAKGAQA